MVAHELGLVAPMPGYPMSGLCSVCGVAPAVAGGLCRRDYDAQPARRAARAEHDAARKLWRRWGLDRDPLEGWSGAHGVAVRWSPNGACQYRRRSRNVPGWWEVRRPGHPLAGRTGWVSEPRMWLYDQWTATGRPPLRCHWCQTRLGFTSRSTGATRNWKIAHPAQASPGWWTPETTVAACWVCVSTQRYGLERTAARLEGNRRP